MKYRTKETSVENLRLFFSKSHKDAITLSEAIDAWGGRESYTVEQNENWIRNKLTHLKYHNLIKPVYKIRNSRRVFDKIQLTIDGKRVLGRIESENGKSNEASGLAGKITIEEIMKTIPRIREENPQFEITFEVKPKGS